jgi:ferrous iron transport protein A
LGWFEGRKNLMSDKIETNLIMMRTGDSGVVVRMVGGRHMINRLDALGIRQGKRITKLSSMFMKGPVTIKFDGLQVAIGYRMANKIVVKLD